jgi:hypothetical protein
MYVLTLIFLCVGCLLLYNGSSVNKKNHDLSKQQLESIKSIDSLSNEVKVLKIKRTNSLP